MLDNIKSKLLLKIIFVNIRKKKMLKLLKLNKSLLSKLNITIKDFQEYKQLNELNYPLQSVPGVQLFFEPNNLNRPLEYEIKTVDEVVDIYPTLENLFNIL